MLSAGILLAGILTACPRPVTNPLDPNDDPTAGATQTDPDDGETIDPVAPPPSDAGPPTSMPAPPEQPPEPSPSVEDGFPVQPATPPPIDPKNAPLSV